MFPVQQHDLHRRAQRLFTQPGQIAGQKRTLFTIGKNQYPVSLTESAAGPGIGLCAALIDEIPIALLQMGQPARKRSVSLAGTKVRLGGPGPKRRVYT